MRSIVHTKVFHFGNILKSYFFIVVLIHVRDDTVQAVQVSRVRVIVSETEFAVFDKEALEMVDHQIKDLLKLFFQKDITGIRVAGQEHHFGHVVDEE